MATTCYTNLTGSADLGQISPPYFIQTVTYTLINTLTNAAILPETGNGGYTGQLQIIMTPPVASQAAVLAALQVAIQAAETATPSLTFIWLGL